MSNNVKPPRLPDPGAAFDAPQRSYISDLLRTLRLYFEASATAQDLSATRLRLNIERLPTQADLATLRSGDVYRDTSAGDVLKIKP
jgi:hypothetical protein